MSNARTIAKNTGWYGLENGISFVVALVTSIAIARTLGPSKMGYIIYVIWIASIVSSLGGMGIPATTVKYMAEFVGAGDLGTARYIYIRTLLLQMGLATIATAGILFWVRQDAQTDYVLASALVALSIWPSMVNSISANANLAQERMSANLPGSVISIIVFFISILATVEFKWGVIGVGASMLLMRSVDFLVRLIPTIRGILSWEMAHVYPTGLGVRMMSFAWQSVASMILALIVWDRSEFFLLKQLCSDIRQIAYYSVAFNMAERLLISASVFGGASAVTMFAQYGRNKSRLPSIAASTFRYLALTSIPLHFIASALAVPALLLLYGRAYRGASAVVLLAPLLCLPKAFLGPAQSLLQTAERQGSIIAATIVAGLIDLSIAWYLIPSSGAVGACVANGAAQIMAVGTMWGICIKLYKVKLPWLHLMKISFISTAAALTAYFIAIRFSPVWGILLGGCSSLIVLFGLIYILRVIEPEDQARFMVLSAMLPPSISKPIDIVLSFVTRRSPERLEHFEALEGIPVRKEAMHD